MIEELLWSLFRLKLSLLQRLELLRRSLNGAEIRLHLRWQVKLDSMSFTYVAVLRLRLIGNTIEIMVKSIPIPRHQMSELTA